MLRSHGLHPEDGADPSSPGGYAEASLWAACVEAGLDREVATPETLAALADTFRAVDADGRGVLLTVDHAGVGERPDTRAAGWIKALHADGGKLWAWIELTPYGHGLVDSAEFAFFSTKYDYRDFKRTEAGAEPQRLDACAPITPCVQGHNAPQRSCAARGAGLVELVWAGEIKYLERLLAAKPMLDRGRWKVHNLLQNERVLLSGYKPQSMWPAQR